MSKINELLRERYNLLLRKRLKNKEFSLISDNCNGACILHDLGLRFNSPFVNLWIQPEDYIKLLQNMDRYISISHKMTFVDEKNYPVGVLGDIKIYFMHYNSQNEAYMKWNERIERLNKDNLFIIFTDRNGCSQDNLLDYDKLPYKHKIVFTHISHPEIKSAYYMKKFQKSNEVGILSEYCNRLTWKKYYDDFDFIKWFNTGEV